MTKIYVGCCINSATEEYLKDIANLKNLIKENFDCEIMEFIPKGTGTVEEVYENDIHNAVSSCDIMVAEISHPSLGLGWEMATIVEKLRKPLLMCAKENVKVSKLVEGAQNAKNPECRFVRYVEILDLIPHIQKMIPNEKK